MHVTSYHIHNVLRAYGKQLSQGKRLASATAGAPAQRSENITISPEARRAAVVDKVSADIVQRIAIFGPRSSVEQEVFSQLENEVGNKLALEQEDSEFVFKVVDENSGEETKALSNEDSQVLKGRLEEIAKSKVDKSMF